MFKGFPEVGATTKLGAPIADNDTTREDGPVMTLDFPQLEKVTVDAHTVLRIVKHARDGGSRIVYGTLTGMQIGKTAEVTNAIPMVMNAEAEDDGKRDFQDHQTLIDRMGAAGFDRFPIGRYVCCTHSAHVNSRQLGHLESCVRRGEPSMLLAYDPLRSAMGKLFLKAYVLSDEYLRVVREEMDLAKRPDAEAALEERRKPKKLSGEGMLKEVPVEIFASALQEQLLAKMAEKPRSVQNAIIHNHDLGRYTERSLRNTNEVLERLRADVFYRQTRHREEGVAPLRAETHTLLQQLQEQAAHIEGIAAGSALNLDFARQAAAQE